MIEVLLGSEYAEKVLVFILLREKGYASEMAEYYDAALITIQNQLKKFENGGVLVSFKVGKTRVYEFNPSFAFLPDLKALLQKAVSFYPPREVERLKMNRRRPRRTGKPL